MFCVRYSSNIVSTKISLFLYSISDAFIAATLISFLPHQLQYTQQVIIVFNGYIRCVTSISPLLKHMSVSFYYYLHLYLNNFTSYLYLELLI
jgi:hypothetical protein